MTRAHITALLISPLVLLLCGCQPDTPSKQAESSPANAESPVVSKVTVAPQPAAQPATVAKSESSLTSTEVDGRALAQKSGCFTCHAMERKLVGPAWNDIAAKYRGQKDAEAKLVVKVAKGGSGVWGSMPMPPNAPRINDNDIKMLVRFVLSLK
jgi:cytochrome c